MESKNSFVLYADLIHTVRKLPDETAGKLFKLILDYVNDKDPDIEALDLILQVTFEPIRQQLKRDLRTWKEMREKRVEAGKLGGQKSGEIRSKRSTCLNIEANEANASNLKQTEANEAVNVSVTVNDTVNNPPCNPPAGDDVVELSILNHWNEKDIIRHRKLNTGLRKAITRAIKEHGSANVFTAIDHYSEALNSNYKLVDYKWGLLEFLKQSNAMPYFFDDGVRWKNYQEYKKSGSVNGNKVQSTAF